MQDRLIGKLGSGYPSGRSTDVYPVQLEHSVAHAAREASGAGDLEERSGERTAAEAI